MFSAVSRVNYPEGLEILYMEISTLVKAINGSSPLSPKWRILESQGENAEQTTFMGVFVIFATHRNVAKATKYGRIPLIPPLQNSQILCVFF